MPTNPLPTQARRKARGYEPGYKPLALDDALAIGAEVRGIRARRVRASLLLRHKDRQAHFTHMLKHEEKICARCRARFECKVGSILLCQCMTVPLTYEQREYIALQYSDCLCAACLEELGKNYQQNIPLPPIHGH